MYQVLCQMLWTKGQGIAFVFKSCVLLGETDTVFVNKQIQPSMTLAQGHTACEWWNCN